MKPKNSQHQEEILVTGAGGLIGSQFIESMSHKYKFSPIDVSDPINPVDITDKDQVMRALSNSSANFVVHFAAYTNVTAAFDQTNDKQGPAYIINVVGTKNIAQAALSTNKHLVHISTAYVFDGENQGLYRESDTPNPIEWYGKTKLLAEETVQSIMQNWTILRIDQPFGRTTSIRPDVARRIYSGLLEGNLPPMFTDHFFGPTYIDDLSRVLDWVVRTKTTGLFHASSGEKWTDFDFAKQIREIFKLPTEVKPGSLDKYLETLERPYQRNTAMDVSKLKSTIDFELTPIKTALESVEI